MSLTNALSPAACEFYSKTPDAIFTPEQFTSDERLMFATADEFARAEVLPLRARLEGQEEGLMPKLIHEAGNLGLCGVDAPEEYGGLGLPKNVAARILEFLSAESSFGITLAVTSGIGQVGLSLFGSDEQKRHYLPPLATGDWIGAYALSEPNSGSDALSAMTRADLRGNRYVLNGTKMWITNAKWADLFLVMAKINGLHFSAFLVERGCPGLTVEREEHKLGLKGSSTARVTLEDVEVPVENLMLEPGKGHHVALNALNLGRFKLAAYALGSARDAIGVAARYALERKQFGRAIGDFGLIRQKTASCAAWFYVAESMIYRTGALIDDAFRMWGGPAEGNRRAAEEFAVESSACKVFATETQAKIIDEALQVFGGYGFTEEFPVARHYRDARVARIFEGTNEINRVSIGQRYIRRIRDGLSSPHSAGDSFLSELAGKAVAAAPQDQIRLGALADLLILAYAEQSARLRAAQAGGFAADLYLAALPGLNARGAEAMQLVTGETVTLPPVERTDLESLADRVYGAGGPLL